MHSGNSSAHQQLQYGNSKLIFYFQDSHSASMLPFQNHHKVNKNFASHSHLHSHRQVMRSVQIKTETFRKKHIKGEQEGHLEKKGKMQIKISLKKESDQRREKWGFKGFERGIKTQKENRRIQAKSSLKLEKTNRFKQVNNQRHLIPDLKNKSYLRLSEGEWNTHTQIKSLYGNHHLLYISPKDYLSLYVHRKKPTALPPKRKAQISYKILDDSARIIYDEISSMTLKRNYVDQDFCYLDYTFIGGEPIKWVHIEPMQSIQIFPQLSWSDLHKEQENKENSFVGIIKILYSIQPQIFHRLMEPPQKNVFCVWLFHFGRLQPVVIDGYFPVKGQQQNLYFGKSRKLLWIDIFIKCICKLNKSYDISRLEKMTPSQIYKVLTGLEIKQIDKEMVKNEGILRKVCRRERKKNNILIFKKEKQFLVLDEHEKMVNSLEQGKHLEVQAFSVPQSKTFNIANFLVYKDNVTKIEIQCEKKSWMHFLLPHSHQGEVKMYFYRIRNKKINDHQLCLAYQLQPNIERSLQIEQGHYRILYEDGSNLLEAMFAKKSQQKSTINTSSDLYSIAMLGEYIKYLHKPQVLVKNNNFIQDSQHFYSLN